MGLGADGLEAAHLQSPDPPCTPLVPYSMAEQKGIERKCANASASTLTAMVLQNKAPHCFHSLPARGDALGKIFSRAIRPR